MTRYIEATPDAGKEFYQNFIQKGKVIMLNLLRFREVADYSNLENLKPENEIPGEEAYGLYMKHTLPLLKKAGSAVVFYGKSHSFLIGPESEKWDAVLIVQHESVSRFMEFAQNEEYLKYAGHRIASLEDSRLLPITESDIVQSQ